MLTFAAASCNGAEKPTGAIPKACQAGESDDLGGAADVLVEIRDKVAALKKQGRSLEDISAAKLSARTDEECGKAFIWPAALIDLVYQGV